MGNFTALIRVYVSSLRQHLSLGSFRLGVLIVELETR